MEMYVRSRQYVEFAGTNVDKPHVLISFRSPESRMAEIKPNEQMLDVLFMEFHDTDRDHSVDAFDIKLIAITREQGQEIKDFVEAWKGKVEAIVCQCEAGISRSSGAAAAIAVCLDGSGADQEIFDNPEYQPNMKVYRTVMNAFDQ